jgi:hypothetical protein
MIEPGKRRGATPPPITSDPMARPWGATTILQGWRAAPGPRPFPNCPEEHSSVPAAPRPSRRNHPLPAVRICLSRDIAPAPPACSSTTSTVLADDWISSDCNDDTTWFNSLILCGIRFPSCLLARVFTPLPLRPLPPHPQPPPPDSPTPGPFPPPTASSSRPVAFRRTSSGTTGTRPVRQIAGQPRNRSA